MKRKIILFCLLFLTGCMQIATQPVVTETQTISVRATDTESITPVITRTPIATHIFQDNRLHVNAFKPGENCPNLCWMGIHPGITSAGEAVTLLKNSKDIGQVYVFATSIQTVWLHHNMKESKTHVSLQFSSGVIQSMSLNAFEFLNVSDMLSILGEPDALNIHNDCGTDYCTDYLLYYLAYDTTVKVWPGSMRGLSPTDPVTEIAVNMHQENVEYLQPWLGYGHLSDYLKKPMPTRTTYPVP